MQLPDYRKMKIAVDGRIGIELQTLPGPRSSRERAKKSPVAPGKWRRDSDALANWMAIRLLCGRGISGDLEYRHLSAAM